MSQTFSLVCHETKQRMWIGQGWGKMTSLYSGNPETMKNLAAFLNAHIGKELRFVCDDRNDFVFEYEEFGEAKDEVPE